MIIKVLNDDSYTQLIDYPFPIIVAFTPINENKSAFVKNREFGFNSDAFFEFLSYEYEIIYE
ncbi:hypothetical protein NFC79_17430 [Providencia stuartii]|nr:hypothetical protein NFC79_17430 [Providencia stuartii]